jgi:hypothetical protein
VLITPANGHEQMQPWMLMKRQVQSFSVDVLNYLDRLQRRRRVFTRIHTRIVETWGSSGIISEYGFF